LVKEGLLVETTHVIFGLILWNKINHVAFLAQLIFSVLYRDAPSRFLINAFSLLECFENIEIWFCREVLLIYFVFTKKIIIILLKVLINKLDKYFLSNSRTRNSSLSSETHV